MGKITATDRLIFTLLFSIIIHLSIVLGVTFEVTSPFTNSPQVVIDITLVKEQTVAEPEQADFLAQANNEGGGEINEPSADPSPDITASEVTQQATAPAQIETPNPLPIEAVEPLIEPNKTEFETKPIPVIEEIITSQASPTKAIVQEQAERSIAQPVDPADERELEPELEKVEASVPERQLVLPNFSEIAMLDQQFLNSTEALSNKPKKRRISASTKEYAAAAYMKAWEMKVERIGNFNYPQEAKRRQINGSLMLTVDVNPDGSVPLDGIIVSRSSGHKILDDAAIRIVRLGAPYSAIPDNVLQGNDMLTIIRTWKFETGRGLSTR